MSAQLRRIVTNKARFGTDQSSDTTRESRAPCVTTRIALFFLCSVLLSSYRNQDLVHHTSSWIAEREFTLPSYIQSIGSDRRLDQIPTSLELPTIQPHGAPFEFSACLLMRDDNKILPEWLAYHYEVLPLRRLIVAVDPFSRTDPTPILDVYRDLGMHVTLWTDADYMRTGYKTWERPFYGPNLTHAEMWKGYLWRQRVFLMECTRQLQLENRSWTLFLDTDEYLFLNHYRPTEGQPYHCFDQYGRDKANPQPNDLLECNEAYHKEMQSGTLPRSKLPMVGSSTNATMAHYILQIRDELLQWDESYRSFCWVFPRVLFGAWDSSNHSHIQPQMPSGFDLTTFRTLRYRKTGVLQNFVPGKPILDVSAAPTRMWDITNPHRPHNQCRGGPYAKHYSAIFRVHHYTGTPDEFLTRPGRTLSQFQQRNNANGVIHEEELNESAGWLQSFVERVGWERAFNATERLRQWAWLTDAKSYSTGRFSVTNRTTSVTSNGTHAIRISTSVTTTATDLRSP